MNKSKVIHRLICTYIFLGQATLCVAQSQLLPGNGATRINLPDNNDSETLPRGAEYRAGDYQGAILMPVQLWGAANRPGYYHLPVRTDLFKLISFAGGPLKDSLLDKVTIKRTSKGQPQVIEVNLIALATSPTASTPILEPNDIVIIPPKLPFIDPDVSQTVGFAASILGIVLSSIIITNQLKAK